MQILQKPSLYSFSGNCCSIVVETSIAVDVKLTINQTIIYSRYSPVGNRISISIRKELEEIIPFAQEVANGNIASIPLSVVKYQVGDIAEESFFCINGGLSVNTSAEVFLMQNFLTWRPQVFYTTYYAPQSLAYVAISDCVIKVKGYVNDVGEEFTLGSLFGGNIYNIDVTYGNLRSKFSAQPKFIDIWIEGSGIKTYTQRFVLTETHDNEDIFQWVNSLGGIDTAIFTGDLEEYHNSESSTAIIGSSELEYGVDIKKTYKKYTGYLVKETDRLWVLDMFNSIKRWHLFNGLFRRIIIVSKPTLKSTRGDIIGYEFDFSHSTQSKYINLPRLADDELLNIVSPVDEEVFFLEPRLNSFATADSQAGHLLFPVQYANLKKWYKIPLSDLLSRLQSGVASADHNHDNRYHPLGGNLSLDIAAKDLIASVAWVENMFASGSVGSSEFVSGLLGTGWNIDAKGNAEMNSLILRTFLQTPELIKNQVRVIGTQAWLTECGTTDIVVANPRFRLNVSDQNGQRLVAQFADKWFVKFHEEGANGWFRKDDILRGIYNYDDGFETVFLRVEHSINGGYLISSINGLAPAKEMVLARQGNFTDPARQGSIYLDSAEGYIRVLGEVDSIEIALKNVKMQGGNLRGLRVWGVSDMPSDGLYAPGIVVAADQVAGLGALLTVMNDTIDAQAENINLKADKVTVDGLLNVNGDIRADKIDAEALAASSALIDNLIVKHLSSRPAKSGKGLDIDSSLRMYDGNGEETMKFQVLDDGMPKLGMYKGGASDDNGEIEIRHNEFRMLARTNNGQTTNYVFIDPFAGFELNGYKNNNGSLEFYRLILSKNGISSTPNMVMPGVIAKARIGSNNKIEKTWGKKILQVVPNSVGPGNKRVYHDIGHTDYTTICTAYKSDSHPQVWEEGANYVDIWSEGGFNIILTGNNNG